MENIEKFNIATGEILGHCYSCFPMPTKIYVADIADSLHTELGVITHGDINLGDDESQLTCRTMNWLIKAGYLWCEQVVNGTSYHDVVLTPKALEALKLTPDGLSKSESFGEKFKKESKDVGKKALVSTVNAFLKEGLKVGVFGS